MTVSVYPSILPCFRATPFSYRQTNTIQKTEFESGRTRRRRKAKVVPVYFSLSARFTTEELSIFESWVFHELEDVGQFRVPLKTGTGVEDWDVRLETTDFEKTQTGTGVWALSVVVEAQKQRYLDHLDLVMQIYGVPVDFGDRIQTIVKRYDTDFYL